MILILFIEEGHSPKVSAFVNQMSNYKHHAKLQFFLRMTKKRPKKVAPSGLKKLSNVVSSLRKTFLVPQMRS